MRLAFVNSTHKWGGVKTWCIDMGRSALEDGHSVLVYGQDPRFVKKAGQAGLSAYQVHFGPDFNPLLIARFVRDFKLHGITHVIVNVGKDLRSAGIAARLLGIPLMVRVGNPVDFTNTLLRQLINGLLGPVYLCCSDFCRTGIIRSNPWLVNRRVEAIHPGTPIPDTLPPAHKIRTIIATSQLLLVKRHEDLIHACAILHDDGLPFRLNIVGTGDQEQKLKALTLSLGLQDVISFRGHVADVAAELRQADIFVLPTECEALGIALEEALAQGLYPIARNAGGVPEIWPEALRDNLLPPESGPEQFAAALRKALLLPDAEMARCHAMIQEHARACFAQGRQYGLFKEYLLSLAPEHPSGRQASPSTPCVL